MSDIQAVLLVPNSEYPHCPKCGREVGQMAAEGHCERCPEPVARPDPYGLLEEGVPVVILGSGPQAGTPGVYLPDDHRPGWGWVMARSAVDGWITLRVQPGEVALRLVWGGEPVPQGIEQLRRIVWDLPNIIPTWLWVQLSEMTWKVEHIVEVARYVASMELAGLVLLDDPEALKHPPLPRVDT